MADSILKLRVESSEYDAKLKKAAEGIRHLADVAHKGGGELTGLEKAELDYVKGLGSMETKSRTAAGSVRELESTFKELTVVYNHLNDVEKQDEGGKALRASLEQIKQRAQDARTELEAASKSLQGTESMKGGGGLFSGIGSKMEGALAVFGGNLMTKASEAIVQLGSEMYGMVQQGIELARQGEGIRIAFERLGRGDILDGLREATHGTVTDLELMKAAVKFNDFKLPVEELGTMLAFAQQKAKDTGQSVDYMVDSIVTGLGRKSLMILDNLGLSATEIRERMKETGDMTKAVGQIIREQMAKAGDYVETAADRAAQANVSLQNKMEELGRKFAPVEEASNQLWTSMKIGILDIIGGPLARLLNGLTEAGRQINALRDINGDGSNGAETRSGKALRMLREYSGGGRGIEGKRELYDRQVASFQNQEEKEWRKANRLREELAGLRKQQRENGTAGNLQPLIDDTTRQLEAAVNRAKAFQSARNEYIKSGQQILNNSNAPTGGIGGTGGTGDKKKNTKTEQTEFQKNQAKITELKQQFTDIYSAAAAAGKPLTKEQEKLTQEIQKQIEFLKGRNELIGMWGEMAEGKLTKNDVLSKTPVSLINPKEASEKTVDVAIPRGGLQLDDKAMKAVQKNIDKQMKDVGKIGDEWSGVASAIGAVGNAMAGIEDPAAKVLGTVAQAIATVALGYATATTQAAKLGPWAWIAFAATGLATMVSTISAIHSATGYAEGGMIKGNSYSGDNLMAQGPDGLIGLNAGEIVLNKSQQNNLATSLQGGGLQGLNLTATIRGEQIRLVLNNNGRRTGRGEYVQSRNVR